MRKLIGATFGLTAAIAAISSISGAAAAAPQTIDAFEAAQQAAWNAHDAAAYTAAFDQDASVVTSLGWHWAGRTEAARNLGDGFKFVYAHAHLQLTDVQVRTLTPELSSVTLGWSIDGARTIDGAPEIGGRHGFQTQILQRNGDSWLILAQQDTAAAAPAPVSPQAPAASPAPPASAFPTTPPPVRRCIVARGNGDCLIYGKPKPAPTN